MATTTQTKTSTSQINSAFEQLTKFNEQFVATARKAGNMYVDAYEKTADRLIELESKAVDHAQQEWLQALIRVQIEVARDLTTTYTDAARTLLK